MLLLRNYTDKLYNVEIINDEAWCCDSLAAADVRLSELWRERHSRHRAHHQRQQSHHRCSWKTTKTSRTLDCQDCTVTTDQPDNIDRYTDNIDALTTYHLFAWFYAYVSLITFYTIPKISRNLCKEYLNAATFKYQSYFW